MVGRAQLTSPLLDILDNAGLEAKDDIEGALVPGPEGSLRGSPGPPNPSDAIYTSFSRTFITFLSNCQIGEQRGMDGEAVRGQKPRNGGQWRCICTLSLWPERLSLTACPSPIQFSGAILGR